jgi:hypothetical protein
LIALGLYAQAKEFLAVHRKALEPPYRADVDAIAPIQVDLWTAWAGRARGVDQADRAGSVALELDLDASLIAQLSRVRPHTAVRRLGIH